MTTRQDLEREREALIALRESAHVHCMDEFVAPLTASIERLDALLSLSDEQCAYMVFYQANFAVADEMQAAECDDEIHGLRPSQTAAAHRTVADLVRRTS